MESTNWMQVDVNVLDKTVRLQKLRSNDVEPNRAIGDAAPAPQLQWTFMHARSKNFASLH